MRLLPVDGILVVDKPRGITSRKAASEVGRVAGAKKAGHTGTLDPLATGVLLVCLDRGTLLSSYLAVEGKTYEVTALMGVETDTYDTDGKVVSRRNAERVRVEEIERALGKFRGAVLQQPPPFSAVKHKGRPLYMYARKGHEIRLEPREVTVYSIQLKSIDRRNGETLARLSVTCGAGTYVRSIVHEIGKELKCGACISELTRTACGRFTIEEAVTPETLRSLEKEEVRDLMITLERATDSMPTVTVLPAGVVPVGQGKPLLFEWLPGGTGSIPPSGTFRVLDCEGGLLALYAPPGPGEEQGIAGRAIRVIRPFTVKPKK